MAANAQQSLENDSTSETKTVLPLEGSRHSQLNHLDLARYATSEIMNGKTRVLRFCISLWVFLRTVIDLIRLSPLLVDEDDADQDDDLCHDAQEGPEGGQAAADTQVDLVEGRVHFSGTVAHVVAHVHGDVQVIDGQGGPVGGALDLIPVSTVGDGLRMTNREQKVIEYSTLI